MRTIAAALVVAIAGCAGDPAYDAPRQVRVTDERLVAPVDSALERWSAATGFRWERVKSDEPADLTVRFGSVPKDSLGHYTGIAITVPSHLNREALALTIVHEFGHALGGEHTADPGVLGATIETARDCITETDLLSVCALGQGCETFEPEACD